MQKRICFNNVANLLLFNDNSCELIVKNVLNSVKSLQSVTTAKMDYKQVKCVINWRVISRKFSASCIELSVLILNWAVERVPVEQRNIGTCSQEQRPLLAFINLSYIVKLTDSVDSALIKNKATQLSAICFCLV